MPRSPTPTGAFPHRAKLTRIAAHQALNPLRKLRNRIAHHKPILAHRLAEDHAQILEVTGWISLEARTWIELRSRVPPLLEAFAQGSRNRLAELPEDEGPLCEDARRSGTATEGWGQ